MEALFAFLGKHAPVIIGVLIGAVAKLGRTMAAGQPIRAHAVLGYILMLGMVGLVTTVMVDVSGVTDPNGRAFAAAILALAANDVIKFLATRGWKKLIFGFFGFGEPDK